jgi:murein DD-endopeptidase MepM/ murein hydrolase activator NlpD
VAGRGPPLLDAQRSAEAAAPPPRPVAARRRRDAARARSSPCWRALAALKARYELGKLRRTNLLVTADSVGDLLWRSARSTRSSPATCSGGQGRAALEALGAKRAKLEAVKADYAQRAQFAAGQRAKATRRKDELVALHDSLLAQQDLKEKTLKELKQVQAELTRYVRHLPQALAELPKAAAKDGFHKRKGKMPYPAKGIIEVPFGKVLNPKFNTVTFQKGLDLRAAEGSEVVSVADGKVVHAGPFRGYGNLLIVDHGDGYHTLYAHLATLAKAVGDEVEAGQQVGTVGDTGSLKGAYLYFESASEGEAGGPEGVARRAVGAHSASQRGRGARWNPRSFWHGGWKRSARRRSAGAGARGSTTWTGCGCTPSRWPGGCPEGRRWSSSTGWAAPRWGTGG